YITDCIRIAADMGSPVFCGPVYSAVGKTRVVPEDQKKRERDWCVENLRRAAKVARDYGVTVGLEPLNRFESDMVNTASQALSIVKEVADPAVKIALDTFHCNIEEKNIPDAIRMVGGELLCHVQGNESDRGTPGTGHLDWPGIRAALAEIGYQGAMVIETFGAPSKELARAACIWRPLAGSPDELAREGLDFYRKTFNDTNKQI
ncbi:MAG TPA: sugar phosphate isomerase/epimerase family protein, partial [Anseongella sp.]|nr:sugar phosphate isomerase/epimerase family protein [Anseongella sp.]